MGRVAIVTGVAGGIGRAVASEFQAAGWSVIGTDSRDTSESSPVDRFVTMDLSDPAAIRDFANRLEEVDKLDCLVNCAATQTVKPIADISPSEWDLVMAVNARAPLLLMQSLRPLISKRGSIVNIGSVHSIATSPGMALYASSKGALVNLTRVAALEFAAFGIRVNAVLPGAVATAMLEQGLMERSPGGDRQSLLDELTDRTPLGRIAQPSEVAQVAVFLADSSKSSFMTGATVTVDGGVLARLRTE